MAMDPERRRRIEQLYHSALDREPSQRGPFLAEACGSDTVLRGEVETLIAQRDSPDGLVNPSAWRASDGELDTGTLITPGARMGPYEILGPLGAGGMGEVYRALDTRLHRQVAIKISAQQFSGRFEREARAVAALNHPNICTLYDVGHNFLVMELVQGDTLAARLTKGPLPVESVLRYGMLISEALEAAHEQKIIHRDLKPGNIMLTKTGLKVLDFGLAKFTDEVRAGDEQTESHAVIGTAPYMSPEQALGKELDARSDLFSLGVVLYEMTTGQRPFKGESSIGTIDAILHKTPPPVSHLNPAVPVGLSQIIDKALEKDRDVRYQSASEMLAGLKQVTRDLEFTPHRAVLNAVSRRVPKTAVLAALVVVIAIVSLAAWLVVPRWMKPSTAPAKRMLVVLPFQNLSGDVAKEYFSDGLTEELITALSRMEPDRLGVIARTSSMSYKNQQVRTDQIARDLSVDYVLEGSVRLEGDRVHATAQLIQARDQSNLWADSYDIRKSEAMSLQREITRRVARSLAINLLPARQTALERASTSDPAAYEAYLNGRYQWNKRTGPALRKAIEYFEEATQKDPGFAAAYAGQASSLELMDVYAIGLALAIEREKGLLAKALELDPELSEAYATRALIHERGDWDRHAAENDYRRAIELNPGDATAHAWYGEFLYLSGRLDESWPQLKAAERLDPLSPAIQSNIGWWYLLSHRYEESVAHHRRQLAKWPKFGVMAYVLGQTFDQMKRYPEAIEAYQNAIEGLGRVPYVISGMASSYALAGNRQAALRLLEELRPADGGCHPSGAPSVAYASLGDPEKAFACIERSIEQHSALVAWLKASPPLEPLHFDPRFSALLRRAGFDTE
jgi:serine/threonine protein kinase/Flp pilus assembly protein TadD